MISVKQAQKISIDNSRKLKVVRIPLHQAIDSVLAENVRSSIDMPSHDNSAMDGFVLKALDVRGAKAAGPIELKIMGDIQAGDVRKRRLQGGTCFRIMTGAAVPTGSDTIIPKEETEIRNGYLVVRKAPVAGRHLRRKGEEVKKGSLVLKKGTIVHPGTIGVLASLGRRNILSYQKPRVAVIATGSELVLPGKKLKHGQIYDSNSWMIHAALQKMGLEPVLVERVKDNRSAIRTVIKRALRSADMLILMGGVSVGDYDYVKEILNECDVKTLFWKVRQKPGKPIYFGKKSKTLVFGLPGNPASVFTCFYEYVYPSLRSLMGHQNPYLEREQVKLSGRVRNASNRFIMMKGRLQSNGKGRYVSPLKHQASHMISSLSQMDRFILVPESRQKEFERGEMIETDALPYEVGGEV